MTGGRGSTAASVVAGALTVWTVRISRRHPVWEVRAFRRINRLQVPYPVLWPFQQLGTPWVLPATAALAAASGRPRLALAAGVALPLEKAAENVAKRVNPTPRPPRIMPTVLRDDAPTEGGSFPSGHAALAVTWAVLVSPELPPWAKPLPATGAVLCSGTRVHQGAHHVSDSLAGGLLGLGLGAALRRLARSARG